MKKKLTLLLLLFFIRIEAQVFENGLYYSEDRNELICLKNDTISFRLYNNDAFNTYTLFFGSYISSNDKIKLKNNMVYSEVSHITENTVKNDLIQIYLFYKDNTPIKFAQVTLYNKSGKKEIIKKYSDNEGYLKFNKKELNNLLNLHIKVKIETVGFITEQLILLRLGKSYSIISKIPKSIPFTVVNKRKTINYKKHSDMLEINSFNNRNITFKRIAKCKSCLDLIFKPLMSD